jgi:hypothetical protein
MGMIPIRCTACGEAAQIDEAWLGQLVECPHCGEATPAAAPPPPASAPPAVSAPPAPSRTGRFSDQSAAPPSIDPQQSPPPKPQPATPAPKRPPLTRAERLAIRRRRQLVIACGGGVILLIALFTLLSLRS